MDSQAHVLLRAFAAATRPLVRLLIRRGVTYPVAADALRRLFIGEAMNELQARGMKPTGSAVSLLSGVHRKDLRAREEARGVGSEGTHGAAPPLGLVGEVVGRWLSDARWAGKGRPRTLRRGTDEHSFDALVAAVSTDVGPRAVLDEMIRLQVVQVEGDAIRLDAQGMAPQGDFSAMAQALSDNLGDHASAAAANLLDQRGLLEQALYVDDIAPQSAHELHRAAARAWRVAFGSVMRVAQQRHARDVASLEPEQRHARVRFGVYFHLDEQAQPAPEQGRDE